MTVGVTSGNVFDQATLLPGTGVRLTLNYLINNSYEVDAIVKSTTPLVVTCGVFNVATSKFEDVTLKIDDVADADVAIAKLIVEPPVVVVPPVTTP